MSHPCRVLVVALLAAAPSSFPRVADAADPAAIAKPRFEEFCKTWMTKLRERERENLADARVTRRGDEFVVSYVGYGRKPVRCEARETGVSGSPYVGKLVYHEHRYERRAPARDRARRSQARIVATMEILEVFPFDGARWVY